MITVADMRAISGDSAFLIDDSKTAILYDTGFGFTGERIAENIKSYLGKRSLDYIFLTHSHYDHALATPYILKYFPTAKVVAGEYTKKIFEKPSAKALMWDLDQKFAKKNGISDYENLSDLLKVDISVSEGDVIEAGDMKFTALSLPGHTKCSFGYYLENERLLLSCESLGVYTEEKTVIPSYLVGYRMSIDSIKRIIELDPEKILIPHYGLISGSDSRDYLETALHSAVETCRDIATMLKFQRSHEEAMEYFKNKFYNGSVTEAYPIDAFLLNTSITVKLIEKEIL